MSPAGRVVIEWTLKNPLRPLVFEILELNDFFHIPIKKKQNFQASYSHPPSLKSVFYEKKLGSYTQDINSNLPVKLHSMV